MTRGGRVFLPLHPVVAHPRFVDGQRFLSDPVRLFPSVDLIAPTSMGRVSYSSSSSSPSDHSLSGHTPPDAPPEADSSTLQRFGFILHLLGLHDVVRLLDIGDVGIMRSVAAHPEDGVRSILDLKDTIYDIVHYMSEVRIDRITEIETTQRQLEASQLVASEERASLVERIRSLILEYLKVRAMLSIERDQIDSLRRHMCTSQEDFVRCVGIVMILEALAAHEATHVANALEAENQSQNGSNGDNRNGGNGNGENGNGGNGNPNREGRD
ncbi:hypothetical protein Tco_1490778 [Tanacetum coccineum]